RKLLGILNPGSQLMVIDSAWSKRRQQYRQKDGSGYFGEEVENIYS
ncbi:unnamed protein product, partial [marine sediment metagenome]